MGDRGRRLEQQQRAYELQLRGGLEGAARWTVYGTIAVGVAHYAWPLFRRQTWALKAFIVSSATMSGLVIGADDYLLRYEHQQREHENTIRREARNALAKEGIIATETEIRRWRARRDKELEEARLAAERAAADLAAANPDTFAAAVDSAQASVAAAAAAAAETEEERLSRLNEAIVDALDASEAGRSVEAALVAKLAEARNFPHSPSKPSPA